ncbi:MAG TPA: hypothetical protein VIJ43_03285 [Burkholderiales bacterium]
MNRHFDLAGMLAVATAAAIVPASPGASRMTGHAVMADGGRTAA